MNNESAGFETCPTVGIGDHCADGEVVVGFDFQSFPRSTFVRRPVDRLAFDCWTESKTGDPCAGGDGCSGHCQERRGGKSFGENEERLAKPGEADHHERGSYFW